MKKFSVKKLALAGMFCALCVVGSVFSFPMFGSKCAPVQHMVNVLCAVLLGPWWGVGVAFVASLLRNILGLGSLMAFPGSMFGALLCGLVYAKTKNLIATLVGEVFGTSILGGLCAYPVAIFLMGKSAGDIAFYATPRASTMKHTAFQRPAENEFRAWLHAQAERKLRSWLGLLLVAEKEGLAPTDAEVEAAAAHWDAKLDGERTFPANDARKVRQRLSRERAEQFIVEHSTLTPPPTEPIVQKVESK